MSYFNALMVAEARRQGHAQRSATLRHRHLTRRPLGLLLWQLGAEPFTAAAVAFGFGANDRSLAVPAEPRNRDLAFAALTRVAKAFNPWFERAGRGDDAPQIVVPNRGNLTLLGRLGRRLAYLPTDGPQPADPVLVRFGQHLGFLADRARWPGQQLTIVLTELVASHWISELSALEAQSLPALDAAVEPPPGLDAHTAAALAERIEIGPLPSAEDDDVVDRLLAIFNQARAGRTEERAVAKLRAPLEEHYSRLIDRGWPLLWRCLERERGLPEAPSAARRWQEDVDAHQRHVEWVVTKGGRYRTRNTMRQAARTLRNWEDAQRMLSGEEAIDDPLRMVPSLLTNEAICGEIVSVDMEHRIRLKRSVLRPRLVLATPERCTLPIGKQLYWTKTPRAGEYTIVDIEERPVGSHVTLQHETSTKTCDRPTAGQTAVFSVHHVGGAGWLTLPDSVPWTHARSAPPPPIDEADEEGW